ncbi:MAG TPA: hypothetical protein VI306_12335 [Pyrinomonadaceae bacterium]
MSFDSDRLKHIGQRFLASKFWLEFADKKLAELGFSETIPESDKGAGISYYRRRRH